MGLAQLQPVLLCQTHKNLARPIEQFGIGGEHHVLGLRRRVDDHAREIRPFIAPAPCGNPETLLDERLQLLLTQPQENSRISKSDLTRLYGLTKPYFGSSLGWREDMVQPWRGNYQLLGTARTTSEARIPR